MKKNKRLLAAGLLIIAILPILWMVLRVKSLQLDRPTTGGVAPGALQPQSTQRGSQQAKYSLDRLAKWKAEGFVSLTNDDTVRAVVGVLDFRLDETLNSEQLITLTNAAVDLIGAFQNGGFEDYTKFRIPVNKFHFSPGVSNAMQQRYSISAQAIRDDPAAAWKQYWNVVVSNHYSNYWVGVSVTNSFVHVERSLSPTNDLAYSLTMGGATFTVDSLINVKLLAQRLQRSSEKIDAYVKSALSSNTLNILLSGNGGLDETRKLVVDDLNALIQKGAIYDPKLFEKVTLSPETKALLSQKPTGDDQIRLNRLLLVDAFPHILAPHTWVENVGFAFRRPSVIMEPSRAEVMKADGFVNVATMRILAKPRGEDPVYPVYVRWYWSPQDKKWLPEQLIAMYSGPRGRDLFF